MTASLTENSFPSTRCHCELNVSSTWWMDFSAKIYFDPVSAPFCLTPWLSLFLLSFPSLCHCFSSLIFLFVRQLHSTGACFSCRTVDKHDVLQWSVSPGPEPCVSESASVCMCPTLIPASVSQTAKRSDWLELGRVTWDKENIRRVILADQTAALL